MMVIGIAMVKIKNSMSQSETPKSGIFGVSFGLTVLTLMEK